MTWRDLLIDWHGQLDRLSETYPYADPCALARFRGNREFLARYIAETHDLTLTEAYESVNERLLVGARVTRRAYFRRSIPLHAAE